MSDFLHRAMEGMSSKDPEVRMISATEIHHIGRALADHAVFPWWQDLELFSLLEGAHPFLTVGLAVTPERFERIHEAYGLPRLAEVPPDQDAREFELHLPGGLSMDVLTSRDPNGDGAIARFLKKSGEGVQQVELRCKDVDRATMILMQKFSLKPVYPSARPGADGTRINFFLLPATGASKVLVELYEPAPCLD
jgi:methylmalonyl-CoA/ethylmalonyl-CoA epimerase